MSERFGIDALREAGEYLKHAVLGARLRECTEIVNGVQGRAAVDIFGELDAMKFRSSMTLFSQAGEENGEFILALEKYFGGKGDPITLERIRKGAT
jgi:uncharacterized protein (DUF1810 family)